MNLMTSKVRRNNFKSQINLLNNQTGNKPVYHQKFARVPEIALKYKVHSFQRKNLRYIAKLVRFHRTHFNFPSVWRLIHPTNPRSEKSQHFNPRSEATLIFPRSRQPGDFQPKKTIFGVSRPVLSPRRASSHSRTKLKKLTISFTVVLSGVLLRHKLKFKFWRDSLMKIV